LYFINKTWQDITLTIKDKLSLLSLLPGIGKLNKKFLIFVSTTAIIGKFKQPASLAII